MIFIHTADVHLDSVLGAHFLKEQARERRSELLSTFLNIISYASDAGAAGILISGDLFDVKNVSAGVKKTVLGAISSHPEIAFFYLRGNHDAADLGEGLPENLYLFDDTWTTYTVGPVSVTGVELTDANRNYIYDSLSLDMTARNIVMLHGQEAESGEDRKDTINLRLLRNKGIDYLALGHVHAVKEGRLDARGVYVYPGCPEGRGFDECGAHGFYRLDIDEETLRYTFIPFAKRTVFDLAVDIADTSGAPEVIRKIREEMKRKGVEEKDLLQVTLVGETAEAEAVDTGFLESALEETAYVVRVRDRTRLRIDPEGCRYDASLKGEFVRLVLADESLSADDRSRIIRAGFLAMKGEEIDL